MRRHTVTIDIKGVHNTISIDKVTLASKARRMSEAATQVGSPTEIDDQPSVDDKGNSREYLVDKLVDHQREIGKNL